MLLPRFWAGFTVGFGTGVFAREFFPAVRGAVRPIVKGAIKNSMRALYKGQEVLHRMAEFVEDSAAEAKTELHEESAPGDRIDVTVSKSGGQVKESRVIEIRADSGPKEERHATAG